MFLFSGIFLFCYPSLSTFNQLHPQREFDITDWMTGVFTVSVRTSPVRLFLTT